MPQRNQKQNNYTKHIQPETGWERCFSKWKKRKENKKAFQANLTKRQREKVILKIERRNFFLRRIMEMGNGKLDICFWPLCINRKHYNNFNIILINKVSVSSMFFHPVSLSVPPRPSMRLWFGAKFSQWNVSWAKTNSKLK